jgi:hypothetical protein
MDSLLDALQEGRLIELLDNNKEDALQFLAHIIEAIPSLPAGTDVMERSWQGSARRIPLSGRVGPVPTRACPSKRTSCALWGGAPRASITALRMEFPYRLSSCISCGKPAKPVPARGLHAGQGFESYADMRN